MADRSQTFLSLCMLSMILLLLVGCTTPSDGVPPKDVLAEEPKAPSVPLIEQEVDDVLNAQDRQGQQEFEQPLSQPSQEDSTQLSNQESELLEDESVREAQQQESEGESKQEEPVSMSPMLVNGKTLSERISSAYTNLHEEDSSLAVKSDFPDLALVYTDDPREEIGNIFPEEIIPFKYYYSSEADKTFSLCNVHRSVFICDGKLDRLITQEDIDSGRCKVTREYDMDPRLR